MIENDQRFDDAYYRRWYGKHPVQSPARIAHLADATLALARWWGIPIRSVLDVGAGPGWWGRRLGAAHPRVRYTGVDISEAACRRYGHEQHDIATWRPQRQHDLVVCQGTLHYLDDRSCVAALDNLVGATCGLLLLEIPTLDDLDDGTIDAQASDLDARWRPSRWYRQKLRTRTVEIGAGLHLPKDSPHRLYALERR